MAWFRRKLKGIRTETKEKKDTPEGLWHKTPSGNIVDNDELINGDMVRLLHSDFTYKGPIINGELSGNGIYIWSNNLNFKSLQFLYKLSQLVGI